MKTAKHVATKLAEQKVQVEFDMNDALRDVKRAGDEMMKAGRELRSARYRIEMVSDLVGAGMKKAGSPVAKDQLQQMLEKEGYFSLFTKLRQDIARMEKAGKALLDTGKSLTRF